MNKLISIIVVALAAVGMVEAKHEVRPVSHPVMHHIAFPTDVAKEKPKFNGKRHKRHCKKHHACSHKHGVRHIRFNKRPVRKHMIIVRPVGKKKK